MQGSECSAGAEPKRRDSLRVATKSCNIVFDPLETSSLVSHPDIERLLILEYWEAGEPEDGEPIIQGDMLLNRCQPNSQEKNNDGIKLAYNDRLVE